MFYIPLYTYWDIMSGTDHAGYKKIQCWIPESLWAGVEALNYPSQTSALTEAFKALLEKSQNIPDEPQEIPRLEATIEGLRLLLQEKDQRIDDLRKDKETLSIFAHYFKSLEHKRLDTTTPEPQESHGEQPGEAEREHARTAARETRTTQEKSGEKALIRKSCRYCGAEFEAANPRKEYCKDACKSAHYRQQKELKA